MARYNIFDLDGTVVDSSHRHVAKPDGSFCLDGWRANCTPEKIMQDKLLPLAQAWRAAWSAGNLVIVCTARVMTAWDFDFLRHHGLHFDRVLSRHGANDMRPDPELKVANLSSINVDFRKVSNIFYEDNDAVRDAVVELGIKAIHPRDVA
jgi:hypothetical protein